MRKFKAKKTYTPSSGPKAFRGWNEWQEGDRMLGIYRKFSPGEYRKQKTYNYEFEVIEANFQAPIEKGGDPVDLTGQILVINHMGQFVSKMEGKKDDSPVSIGQYVDFTYGGKVPDKNDPTQLYHQIAEFESGDIEEEGEEEPAKAKVSKDDL